MRKLLLSALVAVSMTGCATPGGGPAPGGNIFDQVRAITSTVCAFLPTAETIGLILAAGNPALQSAADIANAICAAVAPVRTSGLNRRAVGRPVVGGVVVHGKFLK